MIELDNPEVHGMRAENFKRMIEGYRGTLARHDKIIVIAVPFETEQVAKNAENYIVGDGDREGADNAIIDPVDQMVDKIYTKHAVGSGVLFTMPASVQSIRTVRSIVCAVLDEVD